jgi:hypothetical protein
VTVVIGLEEEDDNDFDEMEAFAELDVLESESLACRLLEEDVVEAFVLVLEDDDSDLEEEEGDGDAVVMSSYYLKMADSFPT